MSQENNFVPEQGTYKPLTPFQLFVKSNFPFIENTFEALDNYGLYCKIVEYLNDVISNENTVEDNVTALYNAFVSLNNYVSNYFDNLDVQEEINNKLDEMTQSGELQTLLNNLFINYETLLNQEVSNREYHDSLLENQITALASGSPAGVYATAAALASADPDHSKVYLVTADGKWYYYNSSTTSWTAGGTYQSTSFGDNISILNVDTDFKTQIKSKVPTFTLVENKVITSALNVQDNDQFTYTSPIHLNYKDKIKFYGRGNSGISGITLCDSLGNLIRNLVRYTTTNAEYIEYTAPADCYVILCSRITNQYENIKIMNNILSNNQFDELFFKKIDFINNQLITDKNSFNSDNFTENYYVNTNNGTITPFPETSTKKFYASNFIEVYPNSTIILLSSYFLHTVSTDVVGLCVYDENKNFIQSYQYNNTDESITISPNANIKYIRFTVTKNMMSNNYWIYYKYISEIITSEINKNKEENDNPQNYLDLYKTFQKVGIIGDSLASGESAYKDNGVTKYVDLYQFSWGQFMSRASGNTYYNFSKGGLSTRTWLTDAKGLTLATDGNHDCDCYIMGLGVNDTSISGYLGTSADIDTSDYDNNADSFYGNYAKIIQILTERNEKVKFFLLTIPNSGATSQEFNTAIRYICNLFNNCYLIDLASEEYINKFESGFIYANKRSGHFNAIAYNYISQIISTIMSKVIYENYEDFEQVEFIMTDYEWTE